MHSVCNGGDRGPQTDKHMPPSTFTCQLGFGVFIDIWSMSNSIGWVIVQNCYTHSKNYILNILNSCEHYRTDLPTLETEGKIGPATASGYFMYAGGATAEAGGHVALYTQAFSAHLEACLTFDFSIFVSIWSKRRSHEINVPWWCSYIDLCAAKEQYRKFETNIPRKGIARGHSPNSHIHVSVSDLYIPRIRLPIMLKEIYGPILGIFKSLTDTWMCKLGLGPRNSQKRNT